jgi:hypothetical protein
MKKRPYWFVDAKWISGIIFVLLCTPMLLAFGLTQATSETVSVHMFSIAFTEMKLAATPAEAKSLAESVYTKGSQALIDRLPDKEAKQTIESVKTWIDLFTKPTNNWFLTVFIVLLVLEILPFGLLIFFSHRFGRIKSPGYALLFGGLPGLVLTILLEKSIIGSDFSLPVEGGSASVSGGRAATQMLLPVAQMLSTPFYAFVYLGLALVLLSLTLELSFFIKQKLAKQPG